MNTFRVALLSSALLISAGAREVAAQADEGPNGPPVRDFVSGLAIALVSPTTTPQGSNDWTCRPTAEHPRPVVLVHGTFENALDDWGQGAPVLKAAGYCVFAL